MRRVGELLGEWAARMHLGDTQIARWRAAGWLHDVLRDADADTLRAEVPQAYAALPAAFLHGPAAAARLEAEGIEDAPLLDAIRFHTLGDPGLDRLGLALIAADYLEPGRSDRPVWRSSLRARMPDAFDDVIRAVIADKLRCGLEREEPLTPGMIALWNAVADRARSH